MCSMQAEKCDYCGEPVYWVATADGRNIRVNQQQDLLGGDIDVAAESGIARFVQPGRGQWTSHFSTCPHVQSRSKAKENRKRDKL